MRWLRLAGAIFAVFGMAASTAAASSQPGSYRLEATSFGTGYAPTFTGNGWLGVRVPATGQGYAGGTVPAQSELAGFYAKPTHPATAADAVQQRANIPTWSTLAFSDGGQAFSPQSGKTTHWSQTLDLHNGVISTSATWQAPDGHTTQLAYQVFTDRANEHYGLVQLQVTPEWSGTATVTDEIDGRPATLTDPVATGIDPTTRQDYVAVRAQGTGIQAAIASQLQTSPNITATPTRAAAPSSQSAAQQLSFPVVAGQTYTITKYVGVDDSQNVPDPLAAARTEAGAAAAAGWSTVLGANDSAWSTLWKGNIDILGDKTLASDVNASEFYLWSSTRDGVDWSISPAGLSSNGYDGHIFWDAETWMYPSLLAQHPDLAAEMNAYRFARLGAAQQHATATHFKGARFPWESALDGTEQIPPPTSVNSEGLYEQHITADIALAQWQYYLVSGDRAWLGTQGWPVISGAAAFWASHATRGAGGSYHLTHVTGPDEENPDVNDEAYTMVAARTTLQDAVAAAKALGRPAPAAWTQIANGLQITPAKVGGLSIYNEFSGYRSQMVKQADVTLLQYPWLFPMSASVARNDLNFYVPRTDPGGPSMSDAVSSIDTSALGSAGCASYVYTERSYQPFIRDVFDQFSETRTGGAFTFMTGIGGFLQEFLYGYSGLRWQPGDVQIAPSLTSQLSGVVLHDLTWRGRTFTVSVGSGTTTVTLASGAPLPVSTPQGRRTVSVGHPLQIRTARPDLKATSDGARCQPATASSAAPGAPALAAVDGSPATDWAPVSLPATLAAPVKAGDRRISRATLVWGQQWPAVTKPNVPPAPGPVKTLRPRRYLLQVSADGHRWRTVSTVAARTSRTTDTLRFPALRAVKVRVQVIQGTGVTTTTTSASGKQQTVPSMPQLEELTLGR